VKPAPQTPPTLGLPAAAGTYLAPHFSKALPAPRFRAFGANSGIICRQANLHGSAGSPPSASRSTVRLVAVARQCVIERRRPALGSSRALRYVSPRMSCR
jgi:hypothetical protein